MATPKGFLEVVPSVPTGASCIGLASIPVGADSALIRAEGATVRYSETFGSYLTASVGLPLAPADGAVAIGNLTALRFTGLVAGGQVQVAYYAGFNPGFLL
jgi:hypothetical protein